MNESITLDQLGLFLSVAEQGSFSAAGRQVRRVHSAVGYGIANLEAGLGIQLFERSGPRRVLTAAGRALLPEVREVIAQVDKLKVRANDLTGGLESSVAIAVEAIIPGRFVAALCEAFARSYPSVSLRLRTEGLGGVAAVVLDRNCILGISGDYNISDASLRRHPVMSLPIVPIAAPEHELARARAPISQDGLVRHTQVTIAHGRYGADSANGLLSDRLICAVDAATKLALIKAGLGWGFVPAAEVRNELKTGAVVALHFAGRGPQPIELACYAIFRSDTPLGPAAQGFLRLLESLSSESALS